MKYLKKFESDNNLMDKEYLNNCFIELIDSRHSQGFMPLAHNMFIIRFVIPKIKNGSKTVEKAIEEVRLIENILLEVKDGITKVKAEYPEIDYDFRYMSSSKWYELKITGPSSKIKYDGKIPDIPFPKEWGVEDGY